MGINSHAHQIGRRDATSRTPILTLLLFSSHDTASFALASIRKWCEYRGCVNFKESKKILITADGGGSNSTRSKLWKVELKLLSKELNIEISVCHFPPGTSKLNKIEHRLFSYINELESKAIKKLTNNN